MFVDTLDELNWMDEESKRKAQEKVGELQPVLRPEGKFLWSGPHTGEKALVGGKCPGNPQEAGGPVVWD